MNNIIFFAEHLHDDFVELFHNMGCLPGDLPFSKELFGRIYALTMRRMCQLAERQQRELSREYLTLLARERDGFWRRVQGRSGN